MAGKRCRHKQTKQEECHDVGWRKKYPKGSFIVMPKEDVISSSGSSLYMTSWECVDKKDLNPNLSFESDINENQSSVLKDSDWSQIVHENNQEDDVAFQTETFEFDNSFFQVELVLSNKENQLFNSENPSQKSMEIDGFIITAGNSCPPSFVLDLHKPNESDNKRESYIIGRKLDVKSSAWLISVQGDSFEMLRERMIAVIKRGWSGFPCLSDLIHAILEIDTDDICKSDFRNFQLCSKRSQPQSSHINSLWKLLPNRPNVIICSAEEAYSTLQINHHHLNQQDHKHHLNEQEHQHHLHQSTQELKVTDQLSQINVYKTSFECDVCYLQRDISINSLMLPSCGHVFCVSCWRSHFYHSIRHGATYLTCMAAQCTTHVDVTTAMTILPHTRIKQWLNQVRDRYLEISPYCTWCPADTCPNVAVSLSQTVPLKSQFGIPITCDCQHAWCSNCQKKPHWPASCDQMSVYNKLLDKIWVNPSVAFGMLTFVIYGKRCPKCHYPIEKNNGCVTVQCTICSFRFCWDCLEDATTHDRLECKSRIRSVLKYTLQNEILIDLPVKFFFELLDVNKKQREMSKLKLGTWLQDLTRNELSSIKSSVCNSSKSDTPDKIQIIHLAKESYVFLEFAYNLRENFLLFLSFVNAKNDRMVRHLYKLTVTSLSQLQFICDRLHEHVLGKSPRHILKFSNVSQSLLKSGTDVISQMTSVTPALQKTCKDVKTDWMEELDPKNFMRYK